MDDLKKLIREVQDFPKPGILFYDITTLLKDPVGLRGVIDSLKDHYQHSGVDLVIGIEARGFIFASALARFIRYLPWMNTGAIPAFACSSLNSAIQPAGAPRTSKEDAKTNAAVNVTGLSAATVTGTDWERNTKANSRRNALS